MVHGAFEPLFGVDHYGNAGRMRGDDLRVREWAAEQLALAGQRLSASAAEHRRVHIPPPTREQPFPSREALAPIDAARKCAERYISAADRIRNATFPPDPKKSWKQLHGPGVARLLGLDQLLVQQAEYAAEAVALVDSARTLAQARARRNVRSAIARKSEEWATRGKQGVAHDTRRSVKLSPRCETKISQLTVD